MQRSAADLCSSVGRVTIHRFSRTDAGFPMSSCPRTLEPQLCTLVEQPPVDDGWIHEIKYDGWRLLARKEGPHVSLWTRGGIEWSRRLPAISAAVRDLPTRDAWLDGELVHLDENGFPDFDALQTDMRSRRRARLFFHVWDVLWLDGRDLCRVPLLD